MFLSRATIFGFVLCVVDAMNIDVTINGNQTQTIPSGSDVILNCSVSQGDAIDRIDWLKGNQSLTDNVVTNSSNKGVLLLQKVSHAITSGVYTCRTWKNNSLVAIFRVRLCVEEMVLQVSRMFVFMHAGNSIDITCTASQATCQIPNLQWLDLSGKIVTDNIESMSKTKLKLRLFDLKTKDTGKYTCRAMNSAGREVKSITSRIIVNEIKVPSPPLIISPFKQVVGYHGDNITFSFNTRHTPRILSHGTWSFGGRVLHDTNKFSLYESFTPETEEGLFSIKVYNLNEEDSGNYTLRITTDTTPPAIEYVHLKVIRKVIPTGTRNNTSVHVIGPAVSAVTCKIKYPASEHSPELYWLINDTKLMPQSRYQTDSREQHKGHYILISMSLTIYNYSESDCHWYTCGMKTSQGIKEKKVAPCEMPTEPEAQASHNTFGEFPKLTLFTVAVLATFCVVILVLTCLFGRRQKKIRNYPILRGYSFCSSRKILKEHVKPHKDGQVA